MKSIEYFLNGNSCSESIILGSIDDGICDKSLLAVASPFSGGIGSGCLCGAVSGSLMVIGHLYGKNNSFGNPPIARELAKEFMNRFKESHGATCCRVLSRGFEFGSPERKQHCTNFVEFCYNTLNNILRDVVKND